MIPGGAGAQGLSTGGLAGTVKDTSGAVLPGVTVEATSPVLIEKVRSAVSDDRGEYKIVSLPPGTYVITFTLTGFSVMKREGIQLTSGFTAEVNAELRVGGLEETITVSGASPVVDVQNVVQQRVISRDVLDALPINKEFNGFAAITVGASIAATNQDVGGNQDPILGFISIHGTRPRDGRQLIDGLNFNGEGAGRGYYFNGASAQEVVMQTGAPPARVRARQRSGEPHSQGRRQHLLRIPVLQLHHRCIGGRQPDERTPLPGLDHGQSHQMAL
jgi:hypothetical protein